MIIDVGLIKPNTKVYASTTNDINGIINKDDSLSLRINDKEINFPYPSGAARAITKTSVNGWIFWRILDNGEYKELKSYKDKYKY